LKLSYLSLHLGKRDLRGVTDEYLLGKQAPQLSLLPRRASTILIVVSAI
jgi:hypothetical protein